MNDSPIHLDDELTTTSEVEAGVRLDGGLSLTGDAYHVHIEHLIGFEPSIDRHTSGAPMSTDGVELEARLDRERLAARVGHSYHRASPGLRTAAPRATHDHAPRPGAPMRA